MQPNGTQDLLSSVPNISRHRILLENTFHQIKQLFPNLHPSADNQFRITDWTFDVNDLSIHDIQAISSQCQQMGWSFTYRTHLVSFWTKYIAFRQPLVRQLNDLIGAWGFACQNG